MQEEVVNLIPGTVNTRQGAAVASHSTTMATPIIYRASFEDILAEEANYTLDNQPRCGRFVDTMKWGLTSMPCNQQEQVALPPGPISESHPEVIGLHAATRVFRKMWEPKISKVNVDIHPQQDLFSSPG